MGIVDNTQGFTLTNAEELFIINALFLYLSTILMALDNPTTQAAVTTADKVFEQMLHAIVDGTIKSGSKISEPELAKNYQISRSTLREALNRLEKCHLIER